MSQEVNLYNCLQCLYICRQFLSYIFTIFYCTVSVNFYIILAEQTKANIEYRNEKRFSNNSITSKQNNKHKFEHTAKSYKVKNTNQLPKQNKKPHTYEDLSNIFQCLVMKLISLFCYTNVVLYLEDREIKLFQRQ